mmetsp:Transcript_19776/g.33222  ORF Transcript_19776/g.33222 Transcript_19776/m.33222 type:complete len:270 (-) Transcript_19776:737-1546(-)|eukprot:CAMPEP_0198202098 /NCGR_PEP_ID=MMETSP1445-20131203/5171_1 /TAXON_ID=36898 /ORGANISM="Pyramimonas sp., Strain CCMP2087" /LENGTH=269 /DNA_ID=CAMNT_0043872829 /DNA_START=117 /DNA_END=926 /DNA_ORIENTATION=-
MGVATKEDDMELSAPPTFCGEYGRDLVMGIVALGSRFVCSVLNHTEIVNHERFLEAAMSRPAGQGLITVANHTSTLDDPSLPCVMLPLSFILSEHQHHSNRWVFCAKDICFKNAFLSAAFRCGKTLPLERGGGLEQRTMDVAAYKVRNGEWIHTFPEGKVNTKTPDGEMLPFKWGVGKLICDSATGHVNPIVLPWYHRNMHLIKQVKNPLIGYGNTVQVVVGEPVQLDDLMQRCKHCRKDAEQQKLWAEITARIRTSIEELKAKSEPPK